MTALGAFLAGLVFGWAGREWWGERRVKRWARTDAGHRFLTGYPKWLRERGDR